MIFSQNKVSPLPTPLFISLTQEQNINKMRENQD